MPWIQAHTFLIGQAIPVLLASGPLVSPSVLSVAEEMITRKRFRDWGARNIPHSEKYGISRALGTLGIPGRLKTPGTPENMGDSGILRIVPQEPWELQEP